MQQLKIEINKRLITLVKQCPLIYDYTDENYKYPYMKNECFKNFAVIINNEFRTSLSCKIPN